MGKVCIQKALAFVGISTLAPTLAQGSVQAPQTLSDLVTTTLLRGVGGVEINPVPKSSAACLLVAGSQDGNGTWTIAQGARLMTVDDDVTEDVLRELTIKFGGSGLKVGNQLVLLTGNLNWTTWQEKNQHEGVLAVNFERGPFTGFFNGGQRFREVVKVGLSGNELCVANT